MGGTGHQSRPFILVFHSFFKKIFGRRFFFSSFLFPFISCVSLQLPALLAFCPVPEGPSKRKKLKNQSLVLSAWCSLPSFHIILMIIIFLTSPCWRVESPCAFHNHGEMGRKWEAQESINQSIRDGKRRSRGRNKKRNSLPLISRWMREKCVDY